MITLPNVLTFSRIIGALCLLFVKPLSPAFFIIYSLCGVSDVLDGTIARAAHMVSDIGARLDSIADILFYSVLIFRIFPVLVDVLPIGVWIFAAAVLLLRMVSYIVAAVRYKRFSSLHTYLNKASGFLVFLVPYVISHSFFVGYSLVVCAVAALASLEELLIHLGGTYDHARKSLISAFVAKDKDGEHR